MDTETLQRHLTAASGYSDLGMWSDALAELEALPAEVQSKWEIPKMRLGILLGMERWREAALLAVSLIDNGFKTDDCFLYGALAMNRLGATAEAKELLLRGERELEGSASIRFMLACDDAQSGDLAEAKRQLRIALKLNPDLRKRALEEQDLRPLWDSLATEL